MNDRPGPRLRGHQRACRKFKAKTPSGEPAQSSSSAASGETEMTSIAERYGKKGFLKADDLMHGDLAVQIAHVRWDEKIGDKHVDILVFANDERQLILNQANALSIAGLHGDDGDLWGGQWIALFRDTSIEFDGKKVAGVRVRSHVPQPGNGPVSKSPAGDTFRDEIPY
jgi:hypothetical protein